MPKMKTKSGAKKRFRVRGSGSDQALAGVQAPHPHQEDRPRTSGSFAAPPAFTRPTWTRCSAMLPYA